MPNLKVFVNQGYTRKAYYKKITDISNINNYEYNEGEIKDITPKIDESKNKPNFK